MSIIITGNSDEYYREESPPGQTLNTSLCTKQGEDLKNIRLA